MYQRGVKIISVAEFSIMIITLAICACRDTAWVLCFDTIQSKAKMIKTAGGDHGPS